MLSHLSLGVRDLAAAGRFYDAVLAPLGVVRVWDTPRGIGYGFPGQGDKLALFPHPTSEPLAAGPGFHLAFAAPTPAAVDAFHAAAIAGGGSDEGLPGLRPHYGATYYAAFVRDPDGHKLECVHQ
ncbi:MAG: VOC family protein [Myxococcales bacterium]|nr:VOC family protein [Myxococcales bacterium]